MNPEAIIEAMKNAGYKTVRVETSQVLTHQIVKAPKKGERKLRASRAERLDLHCAPASVLDPETKNFACLAVARRLGVAFEDHITFSGTSILRGVQVAADEAPKDEAKT